MVYLTTLKSSHFSLTLGASVDVKIIAYNVYGDSAPSPLASDQAIGVYTLLESNVLQNSYVTSIPLIAGRTYKFKV